MIHAYRYDAAARIGNWLPSDSITELEPVNPASPDFWWLDLETATADEESLVFDRIFPIHPLTREDITRLVWPGGDGTPHLPKVEEFPDYLFIIINPFEGLASSGEQSVPIATTQLSALFTKNLLITHHYKHLPAIDTLQRSLNLHPDQAARGPDYVFHLLLYATVDAYGPLVDKVLDRLDDAETRLFESPGHAVMLDLLSRKREVVLLRKTLILERDVLFRLTRGEFALIEPREAAYYRNVYDHLVRYTELIESAREMVSDLMQTHLAAASNRLNEIMKILAMVSTVILPMSLVAGIYGMNFEFMPELHWPNGYPFALALMVAVGLIALGLFRWRGLF